MTWVTGQRRVTSITNAVFAGTILLPLSLPFASPLFRLPEFAPPQVIYSKDLIPLLLAPWASPSSMYHVLSRLLQSALLFRLPKDAILPCYLFWVAIGLSRTLIGFLLSRSVGWAYPHLFNHWALYESSGGCGPPLVAYLISSGARPDLNVLLTHLRGYRWEVTDSFVLLVMFTLLAGLDHAPWTYSIAIGLAILAVTCRTVFAAHHSPENPYSHPGPDSHQRCHPHQWTARHSLKSSSSRIPDRTIPLPLPDHNSILSQTIVSYLPYVSPSTAFSVFTHARLSTHPSFTDAQQRFKDAPVTFYADGDTHPDAYEGQYLHLTEAFRWIVEKGAMSAEWVMLVEDDFPICGELGWQGVLRVMQALEQGHNIPSPETTKMWGGFVGTGGSGLIIHRTLLPILAHTLRSHALTNSSLPAFMPRRPADIIIQDCLLGVDPLCPTAISSKDMAEGVWFAPRQPTMVITSRLVMNHIGGHASTIKWRVYDSNKWRCGWRHPFHGRPEVIVVPV
ncbi:hypothetical protein J3R82DRAFT_8991 [Butyriboletus roseoflavus]|nr:hypothetical protein J3R82DRAFT_8991 [Butyriboletus roseoflavus]